MIRVVEQLFILPLDDTPHNFFVKVHVNETDGNSEIMMSLKNFDNVELFRTLDVVNNILKVSFTCSDILLLRLKSVVAKYWLLRPLGG